MKRVNTPTAIPESHDVHLKAACPESEYNVEFLQGMLNRKSVSYLKYGAMEVNSKFVDEVACMQERLQRYLDTGNTEWLMDVANFAMILFSHPDHDTAHYRPTSAEESPGLVMKTGLRRK